MDNFEEFIKENRSQFDRMEQVPVEGIWSKIQPRAHQQPHADRKIVVLRRWVFGLAASVVLLLGFGILQWSGAETNSESGWVRIDNPISRISPEMAESERQFKRLIAQKEKEINLERLDKQAFQEIFQELELLEKIHLEYQQDISEFPDKEELIQTLTRYYEQKISILERLSREIEYQNHEKRNYEKHL